MIHDFLHFIGTLLASGSDDMNIVLWRWDQSKPYIVFESGHRSNVFQVRQVNLNSFFRPERKLLAVCIASHGKSQKKAVSIGVVIR